ncbi:hypothetical protein [Hathewaya massiliensis]|uniref:hypothetical protein n=1 Tax=Hathewaya massiliensis TaxID=1964382 RepID=UPI001159007B|nr:hypothetical protein [Hathewaya massiliensis]
MKKIKFISILLICSMLTACSAKEPSAGSEDGGKAIEVTKMTNYNKTFDNVEFQTEIIIDRQDKNKPFVQTTATLQDINKDKAVETLISNLKVVEKQESHEENERKQSIKCTNYQMQNEGFLSMGPISSMLSFTRDKFVRHVMSAFRMDERYEDYNVKKYSADKEFSFAKKKDAFKDIKEKLSFIGIDLGDNYKAYALDYETMKKEEVVMDMDGKEDKKAYKESWGEEDNCYYFIMWQRYDDLPVYHVFADTFKKVSEENLPVKVIYSKRGVEYMEIEKVFNFSKDTKEVSLASFDKVAKTVADKYGMVLGKSSYKVTKAQLYYMVDTSVGNGTYEVNPVWIFNVQEMDKNKKIIGNLQTVVNAVTAKEIP